MGMLFSFLFNAVVSILKMLAMFLVKFMIFTGTWWTVVVFIVTGIVEEKYFPNLETSNPALYRLWDIGVMGGIGLIPPFIYTIQNIIRTITGNPDFSIFGSFAKRKKYTKNDTKITKPKASKEMTEDKPHGVIFGKSKGKYIIKSESTDGHILVAGGAGTGKSSCIAIPTLQSWEQRVFAIDIKGELYQKTAGKRQNIKVFNPADISSYGYDPFYILKDSENPAQDAKEIALAIMPTPPNVKEPFWIEGAQNLFTGAMLYYHNQGKGFIESIVEMQSVPTDTMIKKIMDGSYALPKFFISQFVGLDGKTLSGIKTELSNKIMLFATDKTIRTALSKANVITPADLEAGTDIYICIAEDKLEQWKSLLTLMVNQFLKHFERRTEGQGERVLFMLDEFARLGKIEAVINGLATLRSKGITIMPIIQSFAQLDMIYGTEARKVIADNCAYKAILGATDADTQDYFSKLVGTYDKYKETHNSNFEQYTKLGKGTGISRTTEEKRIIKPEEFGMLQDIVLLSPQGFARVDKCSCYKCKEFAPAPPEQLGIIQEIEKEQLAQ